MRKLVVCATEVDVGPEWWECDISIVIRAIEMVMVLRHLGLSLKHGYESFRHRNKGVKIVFHKAVQL